MSTVLHLSDGDSCAGLDEGRARVLEERLRSDLNFQFQLTFTFNRGMHIEFRKRKQQTSPVLNERSKVMPMHMNWIQVS